MAKVWAILAIVLAAAGVALYFAFYEPQQVALEAARTQIANQERDIEGLKKQAANVAAERDGLRDQLAAKERDLAELQTRAADLESVREQLQRASGELKQQVAAKEKELAALRATQDELVEGLKKEIADRQIQVQRIRDQLRVEMVDEILFDSGEAVIKPAGLEVLRRVGAILKKVENRRIEVQGHTDNVPITGALAKRFPTNWELSAARATNVARFLQDDAQIAPARLSATGFSEYRPRAPNDTEDGRRKNRRIEILLGPLESAQKPPASR
jgi:chemotaxis protein MotB